MLTKDGESKTVTEEYWWTTEDGEKLFAKNWKPKDGNIKARMVVMHGFSDYCDNFGMFFPALTEKGIAIYSWDQRGWGHSVHTPKQMGLTGPTTQVIKDIDAFILHVISKTSTDATLSKAPLFLYGHSMGGAQCLVYASQGPKSTRAQIKGYLSSAPLIAISPATRPWKITVGAGRFAAKFLPRMHLHNQLKPDLLGRDPIVAKLYVSDPLHHDTGTLEGLAGMLTRAEDLEAAKIKIEDDGIVKSIVVLHGTADAICEYGAAKTYYERAIAVKDKELKSYKGWYHMLHAEPGEDCVQYADDVASWILARLN